MTLRAGDWVEVLSKEEILQTLDKNGRLEDMPFMPEMFDYCGKRIRVFRRAHKSCDTISPVSARSLPNSVLLGNIRCNGSAHGGCQAQCAVFWKEAWLKPVSSDGAGTTKVEKTPKPGLGCTEADVLKATEAGAASDGKIRYRCQATDFPNYSTRLRRRNITQFVEDYTSGNVSLTEMLRTAVYFLFRAIGRPKFDANGGTFADIYDRVQRILGGAPYPRRRGRIVDGGPEPVETLDLQPGELVRVKSYDEILATINKENKNRGLFFDGEMVPYCGGVFRVRSRVDQFLDEKTGVMLKMKTPAIILEGGWCRSVYSEYRAFCPRAIYSWWREAWLERAPDATAPSLDGAIGARVVLKGAADEISA